MDKLQRLTYGLLYFVPLNKNNLIFSGGLLYDILYNDNYDSEKLIDIDLFLFGETNKKVEIINTIINNL